MESKKYKGIAYTVRKTAEGRFSCVAKLSGQVVEVTHDKKSVAIACVKGHIDDAT